MKRHAFTMIELVFVVVILGILAAIAIPKMTASRVDAAAVTIRQDIATITQTLVAMRYAQRAKGEYMLCDENSPNCFLGIHFRTVADFTENNWRTKAGAAAGFSGANYIFTKLAIDGGEARRKEDACVTMTINRGHNDDDETSLCAGKSGHRGLIKLSFLAKR